MVSLNERGISEWRLQQVKVLHLGSHDEPYADSDNPDGEMCVMEAVSWVCDLEWGDAPRCVDPSLMGMGIWINDNTSHTMRQRLIPLIPKLVGTKIEPPDVKRRRHARLLEYMRDVFMVGVLAENISDDQISTDFRDWYEQHVVHQHGEDALREISAKARELRTRLAGYGDPYDEQLTADDRAAYWRIDAEVSHLDVFTRYAVSAKEALTVFDIGRVVGPAMDLVERYSLQEREWDGIITVYGEMLDMR